MLCLRQCLFSCIRSGLNAARTVKARAIACTTPRDVAVDVGVVNGVGVYSGDGRVVTESVADPFAAIVTASVITISIVNSAVEPDRRAPVPLIKDVAATTIGPVTGRPEKS